MYVLGCHLSIYRISYSSDQGGSQQHISLITIMCCFYSICIHLPSQTQRDTDYWHYFDMFVFNDWPFPHVYFAKNVAGSVFSGCVVFYVDHYKQAYSVNKT